MATWIKKQFDKFHSGNQLTQWGMGRWYVKYPDGFNSTSMHYTTAKEYVKLFGGEIKHISED